MNPSPKISVIMSVYNGMPYLPEAVKSILNQTYKNFEFIIVDDASTDSSWQYLKSLKGKRVKLVKNEKNLGLASSLNKALKLAKGEYIARMDADDISRPDRLKVQIDFLERNTNIDVCGTWVRKINEKGEKIGLGKMPTDDISIKRHLSWYPSIIHPTMMAKKSFFEQLKGYDPQYDFAEEYEILMRAKKNFNMANIPQELLEWRFWDNRRSQAGWEKMEKVDLKIKIEAFKRGDYNQLYLMVILLKLFITYVLPYNFKLFLFKIFKMI